MSRSFGLHEAISKIGIERRVYAEGKNKSILDPFEPAKAQDIKLIKAMQKNVHKHFTDFIKSRRKTRLTQSDEILFNGEFWTGENALDFGLIDGIDDMYNFIKTKFGENVKIDHVMSKPSWFKRKIGVESTNQEHLAEIIVDKLITGITHSKFNLH